MTDHIHGSALTVDQIVAWCNAWWKDDEWRKTQQSIYGPDIAQHLRGVADMIDPPGEATK